MTTQHQKIIEKWIAGSSTFEETEWLWAEALNDVEILEYIETVAGAKKVLDEKAARVHNLNLEKKVKPNEYTYWILAAAVVFLSIISGSLLKLSSDPYQFGITSIELGEFESGKTTRSGNGYLNAKDSLLNLGIKASVDGKKKNAVSLFTELVNKYPDSESAGLAQINLGIILFNDGKFDLALQSFESALDKPLSDEYVIEKAMWFKTYSLINVERLEDARTSAIAVFYLDGVYRKQAFVLIKRIDQELKRKTFDDDYVLE